MATFDMFVFLEVSYIPLRRPNTIEIIKIIFEMQCAARAANYAHRVFTTSPTDIYFKK